MKLASRKIFWHGTSLRNVRSILKQGLLPNTKKVWEEKSPEGGQGYSLSSFGGVYFSDNWMTAKSAATTASGARKPYLMIGATIETRSPQVIPDEEGPEANE